MTKRQIVDRMTVLLRERPNMEIIVKDIRELRQAGRGLQPYALKYSDGFRGIAIQPWSGCADDNLDICWALDNYYERVPKTVLQMLLFITEFESA